MDRARLKRFEIERPKPSTRYAEMYASIEDKLSRLQDAIKIVDDCKNANWSHVGSLTHVDEKLLDLLEFLQPEEYAS